MSEQKYTMIRIYDPTESSVHIGEQLSRRLGKLEGGTVGVLWNGRPEEDVPLKLVQESLVKQYGVRAVPLWKKPMPTVSAPKELLDEIADQCDAVVTGLGT